MFKAKKKKLTFLRSPNRAKSSQVNLNLSRYIILTSLQYNYNYIVSIFNKQQLIQYINIFIKNFNFFESNLLNLTAIKLELNYYFRKTI